MTLFSTKRLLNLSNQELKVLKEKCSSKLLRQENSIAKIISTLVYYLRIFLFNKAILQKKENIIILNESLFKEFESNRNIRFDYIIYEYNEIIPFKIEQIKFTIYEIAQYILKIISFSIVLLFGKSEQRKFFRKITIDFFQSDFIAKFLSKKVPRRVIFYGGSYYLSYYFASIKLMRRKIATSIYLGSPILNNDDLMYVNEVHLFHKWQKSEIKKYIFADRYYEGKTQHNFLVPKYINNNSKKNNIAIYSSGMYCRKKLNFNNPETLKEFMNNEILLNELITIYAQNFPELSFKIFLHFGIETIETAKEFYKNILKNINVSLNEEFQSQKYFNDYEIGLSNISATLFERLDGGHKSCFVFPNRGFEIFKDTELREITVNDINSAIETIEHLRKLDRNEYFKKIDYIEVL